jgi:RHS repeat-associated protein
LVSLAGQTSASFQYDAFGRRSSKTIDGSSVSFLYDGQNPVQESAGSTVVANLLSGLYVDQFFSRSDASGEATYMIDALGSTIALADGNGVPSTSFTFEPFGNATMSGQASTNAFQFTGRENDATGLYYYRARYYSPSTARFVSEDPLSDPERLGKALSLRDDLGSYTYARDSPGRWIDPDGLSATSAGIVIPRMPFPNGILLPGYTEQDNRCSYGGNTANDRRCVKNCCLGHDDCYADNRCNMSSWGEGFVSPCGSCNLRLLKCLFSAVRLPPDADPCKCPKF